MSSPSFLCIGVVVGVIRTLNTFYDVVLVVFFVCRTKYGTHSFGLEPSQGLLIESKQTNSISRRTPHHLNLLNLYTKFDFYISMAHNITQNTNTKKNPHTKTFDVIIEQNRRLNTEWTELSKKKSHIHCVRRRVRNASH